MQNTLSRRTVFVVLAVVALGVQRKFFPALDTNAFIAAFITLGGWVIGDSINQEQIPEGANKWLNLIKEPRFHAMLGGVLLTVFQMAGVPIDEPTSLAIAGLITSWILGKSYRQEPTPTTGETNVRRQTSRRVKARS